MLRERGLATLGRAHGRFVHSRRVEAIADVLGDWLSPGWTVLDAGCGDGELASALQDRVGDLKVTGCDVMEREDALIPVEVFDGRTLPAGSGSMDAVLMSDVLHHAADPMRLLGEAGRVARRAVLIKDHRTERPLAKSTLRLMDWVGNRPHGVALRGDYWSRQNWELAWRLTGLTCEEYTQRLDLYPGVGRWLFEAGLHFAACLRPAHGR